MISSSSFKPDLTGLDFKEGQFKEGHVSRDKMESAPFIAYFNFNNGLSPYHLIDKYIFLWRSDLYWNSLGVLGADWLYLVCLVDSNYNVWFPISDFWALLIFVKMASFPNFFFTGFVSLEFFLIRTFASPLILFCLYNLYI